MNQPLTPAPRIALVCASWHSELVDRAASSFIAEAGRQGVGPGQIERFDVPGAFEIPLHAKQLAKTRRYEAIVACGLVVDGGIYRHDFVATAVIDGLMRVQLDTEVPVFSVVLTPHHFHEHDTHQAFFHEHLVQKGVEAANACLRTLTSLRALSR